MLQWRSTFIARARALAGPGLATPLHSCEASFNPIYLLEHHGIMTAKELVSVIQCSKCSTVGIQEEAGQEIRTKKVSYTIEIHWTEEMAIQNLSLQLQYVRPAVNTSQESPSALPLRSPSVQSWLRGLNRIREGPKLKSNDSHMKILL